MAIPLIGAVLAAAAPELAQRGFDLLGGIFRGFAKRGSDQVAKLVKEKTGIDVDVQAENVANLIKDKTGIEISDIADNKLTEDQWVKLKEFELQHEAQLQAVQVSADQYQLAMDRLLNENLANARATQTERDKNDDPFVRRFTYHYAYLITGLTFLFIFVVVFMPPEKDSAASRIVDTVLGFLMGVGLSAIIQFFYGSSQGSRDKAKTLERLAGSSTIGDGEGR